MEATNAGYVDIMLLRGFETKMLEDAQRNGQALEESKRTVV